MTYYSAKELARSYRTVRGNTLTIANEIGEEHYGFRAAPGARSVAQLLIHISNLSRFQTHFHGGAERPTTLEGFDFMAFLGPILAEEEEPHSKAQIVERLKSGGESFAQWIEGLSEGFLGEMVTLPAGEAPAAKSRFEMVLGVKEHEMHHRGQLMLIERMVGLTPHLTRQMLARFAEREAQAVR